MRRRGCRDAVVRGRQGGPARGGGRRSALGLVAGFVLLGSLLLASAACRLFFGGEIPSRNPILECTVTVRNPDAEAEFGDEIPEQTLASRTEPFLDDGSPIQHYSLNPEDGGHCPPTQGFDTIAEAEADWSRLVRRRVGELEEDAESGSIFSRFPGGWCVVPGTLECVETDEPEGICRPLTPTLGEPLPDCPPPPPPPSCIATECEDGEPCTGLDFGDVATVARLPGQPPVGDAAELAVTVRHCGEAGAAELVVRGLDGSVVPVGELADFAIPPEGNSCHPANGDGESVTLAAGESCRLTVLFVPESPGVHRGRFVFESDAEGEQQIDLNGDGLAGALAFAVAGADPLPAELCFQGLAAGDCTATRTLEVTGSGPGAVTVEALGTVPVGQNPNLFVLSGAPAAPFAIGAGSSATIDVAWCNPTDERDRATLELRSNDPDQPSFLLDLEHRTAADPPCPPGS